MKRGVPREWGAVHRQPECLCWLQAFWPPKLPSKVFTNLRASHSVVVRSMAWSDALERYSKMLRTLRDDLSEPATLGLVSGSIWATKILGTLATVFFIWHCYTINKIDDSVISSDTKRD